MRRLLIAVALFAAPASAQVVVSPPSGSTSIGFGDTASVDAFGRLRTSEPEDVFSATLQYDLQPMLFRTVLVSGGTVTHLPAQSSATLAVTSTVGSNARLESRQYIRYLPARSQLVTMTGVLGAAQTNVTKTLGYFDANNGIFFKQTTGGLSWCLRSNVSGSPVDTCIAQASWNVNTFQSGTVLDASKAMIWVIDLQWLGMGRVRVGFDIGGQVMYAHSFLTANVGTAVYMATGNLPVAWQIAGAGSAGSMQATCVDVMSEGGANFDQGLPFAASNGATAITVSTDTVLVAVRMATNMPQGGSIVNQGTAFLGNVEVYPGSADSFSWRLIYGATLDNTGWTAVSATHSGVEYSTTTSYTASSGIVVAAGYATGTNSRTTVNRTITIKTPLVFNGFGTINSVADRGNFVLLATHIGSGTGNAMGQLSWVELR